MCKYDEQVADYIDYCQNVRCMSMETIRIKKWCFKNLKESIGLTDMAQITNNDVLRWIKCMSGRNCSARTINARMAHIWACVRYLSDVGVQVPNLNRRLVVKMKEKPIERVYYTKEQIEKVLACADRMEWLMIQMSFECGFRISELRNLRLANIAGNRITFVGKGSKLREVWMSDGTRSKLDYWIRAEGVDDYLWANSRGNPICVEEIRNRMQKPFFKAGFTNFHPHALRHSFATNICSNGASLPIAQRMLGHKNITTTERYVHTFDGSLSDYFSEYAFA